MTEKMVKWIQRRLKEHGFNPGPVDGYDGPRTSAAVIKFKKSVGLKARAYIGPITIAALRKPVRKKGEKPKQVPGIRKNEPVWLRRARQEIGVQEIPGSRHSRRVLSYWELSKLSFSTDETPWCAGFVGAMLEDCGIKSTRSGMARSYSRWGQKLMKPVPGAIVVFWRGSRSGRSGHVAFVTGIDRGGNLMCLGGNQSNAVNIKPFSTSRVLGYRWPLNHALPNSVVPVVDSDGKVSDNEA